MVAEMPINLQRHSYARLRAGNGAELREIVLSMTRILMWSGHRRGRSVHWLMDLWTQRIMNHW